VKEANKTRHKAFSGCQPRCSWDEIRCDRIASDEQQRVAARYLAAWTEAQYAPGPATPDVRILFVDTW